MRRIVRRRRALDRLDRLESQRRAESGAARAYEHADGNFAEDMLAIVYEIAQTHAEFTTDEVWDLAAQRGIDTRERRAMSGVMKNAVSRGYCIMTEEFRASARVRAHSNPKRVYLSLLC